MENYTNGSDDQNQQDRWKEQYANLGPQAHEALHHWKKMMWHKMKWAQQKAAMFNSGMDEETKKKMMKGVGVAAAVGFVLGMIIGKNSRKD